MNSLIKLGKVPGRQRNRPLKDYGGQRFGRLLAVRLIEREVKRNDHLWQFHCDCGADVELRIKAVREGHTSSCGCLARDKLVERNQTHGLSRQNRREYRSWKDMRARCNNPNNNDYADYGGRGIRVCSQWDDFAMFLADMGKRPAGMTIDRIDVNGHYEPHNCRWATPIQQANNKRSNHVIEFNGETKTLQQWCSEVGIEPSKVRYRLKNGWSVEEAFSLEDFRQCPP